MRTCRVGPGKRRESRFGKWSKFQFSDVLGARPPSLARLRPVGQDGADHPDHETEAHDDPDLAGRELPGERGAGLIGPGPEHLRENAGDLDRKADQSHNLTGRTSHLLFRMRNSEWNALIPHSAPQVVARSPDLATSPTEGLQPRPLRESCGRVDGGVWRPAPNSRSIGGLHPPHKRTQMLGSSNPLRGSRESRALASGSFLKVSVSVSHASLRPTFRAMFPRWQVLVDRWAITMSLVGRARDLRQTNAAGCRRP